MQNPVFLETFHKSLSYSQQAVFEKYLFSSSIPSDLEPLTFREMYILNVCDLMICRHKLYHFTVANLVLRVIRSVKW